ncbi:MAG: response regulator transcription factor [Roseiflexaceae bacterium]
MSRTCIAVINDDQAIVDMLTDFLQDAGYETIECFAGDGAYDLIRREHPALVIIDLQMEHREAGLLVLQKLRADPAIADIPAIICSADGRGLREKAAAIHGLNGDVLEKPFNLDQLLAKIRTLLRPHQNEQFREA